MFHPVSKIFSKSSSRLTTFHLTEECASTHFQQGPRSPVSAKHKDSIIISLYLHNLNLFSIFWIIWFYPPSLSQSVLLYRFVCILYSVDCAVVLVFVKCDVLLTIYFLFFFHLFFFPIIKMAIKWVSDVCEGSQILEGSLNSAQVILHIKVYIYDSIK